MKVTRQFKWIVVSMLLLALIVLAPTAAIYHRLKLQDQKVLICHLVLNDVTCLTTNGVDQLGGIKDRQMWFYYNEFQSTLRWHPGRDYFLWRIQQAAQSSSNDMRRRGILSEAQIKQLVAITNSPSGGRNYHFDM